MRIALVIWQLDTYGGSIRQVLELAHALQAHHDVHIFTYHVQPERCFPELIKTLTIHTPPPVPVTQRFYNPSSPLPVRMLGFLTNIWVQRQQVNALAALMHSMHKDHPFDVINYHDNGLIGIAARLHAVRQVWMMNDPPSFIDTREKEASPYAHTLLLRILAIGLAYWTRWQLRSIQAICVLDTRNQQIVKKYFAKTAHVVRSGLEIAPRNQRFRIKKNPKLQLLTTNIFFRHRRYEDVIEAMRILVQQKKLRHCALRIVGDPLSDQGYYDTIVAQARQAGVEKYITFLGKVDEQTLEHEYQTADIFLFPNHQQTWGLSVFEAMARSCACIVSDTAGASEVLKHQENAMIVPAKSPEAIAQAIMTLTDPKVRQTLAKKGHTFVLSSISWQRYAAAMLDVFNRL